MSPHVRRQDELLEACALELAAAHRGNEASARAAVFEGISHADALRVQARVLSLLGEASNVSKVGINADGQGIWAPIHSAHCGVSGHVFNLPRTGFIGFEVEVAARLSQDITPSIAAGGHEAVLSAIESFHIGVELVATRLQDRDTAVPLAQLADGINTFGYVHSEIPFPRGHDLSGALVEVFIDDEPLERQPGASAFGSILNPIIACGRIAERDFDGLKAGMLVTTGALSGLVPIPGPALVRAGLAGFDPVEFQLE